MTSSPPLTTDPPNDDPPADDLPLSPERVAALADAVALGMDRTRVSLDTLVRIPSVSSDPARAADLDRAAAEVARLLTEAGLPEVTIAAVPGSRPAVIGRASAPAGAPTVVLYAHHDVQPTGPAGSWSSPPFEPTERDGRLYGRGTADDKAGIAVHLAALHALRAVDGSLPVGITVLIEGEEEIGSPALEPFLAAYAAELAGDVLVIADSANWRVGVPALTVSLRGLVDAEVTVATLDHGVHSGMYGGPVPDALTTLCRLLATLHDDAGDVAVAGLVSSAAEPLDLDESEFRADAGLLDGVQLIGTGSLTSRLWTRPSLTVLGIDATPVAEAANVLSPTARAKVSLRLAPGQDPAAAARALEDHLLAHAPWGARVTVVGGAQGQPYAADTGQPVYALAAGALRAAFGNAAVLAGAGGSIPLVADYRAGHPGAAVLVTGVEDPGTRAHSTDESLHLDDFARACVAETLLLAALGAGVGGAATRPAGRPDRVRVLVAPSAFSPTLTAVQAAAAIADGWARTAPADEIQVFAVAGGGPGLIDAVQARIPGRLLAARVTGPDGSEQMPAAVLQTPDRAGAGSTAWIEAAQVCAAPAPGSGAVGAAAAAHSPVGTRGLGELVEVALAAGAGTVVIGVGGCAATDAGAGLLAVLGGGDPLETVWAARARTAGVRLVIAGTADDPLAPTAPGRGFADRLTEVLGDRAPAEEAPRHPELGERAAAAAPRPRALPMARPRIDRPLPARAGAGAGGGLGVALLALGALYRPGIAEVLEVTGFAAAVAGAELVVTGEGSFDHRSRTGSAVGGVVSAAGEVGVPCIVLAGRCLLGPRETRALGVASAYAVQDDDGWQRRGPAENVAELAARVARTWSRR